MKRGGFIKAKGRTATLWEVFRDKYAEECRGADGLILCADGSREYSPDLAHIISKVARPDLSFDKSNLKWLPRVKHQQEHLEIKPGKRDWLVSKSKVS